MISFRCTPIGTDVAERFRQTGIDDHHNTIRVLSVDDPNGYPCRHCLGYGRLGEAMLLGSFHLPRPQGIYGGASPIFVHAKACPRFDNDDVIAPILRGSSLASVRCYDIQDQCLYDLGQVCEGADIQAPLHRALADGRTAFVNVHSARPGCLLSLVHRVR